MLSFCEVLREPPAEESLVQNTLWPEVHKLYGHGYELYAVAADPGGRLVASACRSAKQEEAAIIIWRTGIWKQVPVLYFFME
jgi:elongator complex protein 2